MIRPTMGRVDFLGTTMGKGGTAKLVNVEWLHVTVKPERGISAKLLFRGDRLHQVYLLMTIPSDQANAWTTELELERKAAHDEWLRTQLGMPPYQYAWGDVASEFDQKGCVSEIIVTYAT